jgi:hypothetical protein
MSTFQYDIDINMIHCWSSIVMASFAFTKKKKTPLHNNNAIKYDIMHSISHSSPKYLVNVVKGGVAIIKGIKTFVHYNENLYLHYF